ncbi:MAG: regulatory protein [Bradymonadia bacterium]|jgi:regulatory protein
MRKPLSSRRRDPDAPVKPQTPRRLENGALAHLQRFTASEFELRRVLKRRISRAEAKGAEQDRAELEEAIDDIITRFKGRQLVDDAALAHGLVRSYRGRGLSRRAIQHKLRGKGIDSEFVDAALSQWDEALIEERMDDEGPVDPDLDAAWRLARRRRFGPYRRDNRAERRDRDLAAMGRAGFGYGIAKTIIDAQHTLEDAPDDA